MLGSYLTTSTSSHRTQLCSGLRAWVTSQLRARAMNARRTGCPSNPCRASFFRSNAKSFSRIVMRLNRLLFGPLAYLFARNSSFATVPSLESLTRKAREMRLGG